MYFSALCVHNQARLLPNRRYSESNQLDTGGEPVTVTSRAVRQCAAPICVPLVSQRVESAEFALFVAQKCSGRRQIADRPFRRLSSMYIYPVMSSNRPYVQSYLPRSSLIYKYFRIFIFNHLCLIRVPPAPESHPKGLNLHGERRRFVAFKVLGARLRHRGFTWGHAPSETRRGRAPCGSDHVLQPRQPDDAPPSAQSFAVQWELRSRPRALARFQI